MARILHAVLTRPCDTDKTSKQVKHCQDEKTAAAREYKQSMDQLQVMFTRVIGINKQIADNTREQVRA